MLESCAQRHALVIAFGLFSLASLPSTIAVPAVSEDATSAFPPDGLLDVHQRLERMSQERKAQAQMILERQRGPDFVKSSPRSPWPQADHSQLDEQLGFDPATVRAGPGWESVKTNRCMLAHKAWPECVDATADVAPILITGVGRSGTHALARGLQAHGISVCHESLCKNGSVSWPYAAVQPSQTYFCEPSHHPEFHLGSTRFRTIFHVVRHPLRTIASLTTMKPKSWRFIAKHTPSVPGLASMEPLIKRALIHWITWNRMIEQYADWRFQAETTSVPEVCLRAGFPPDRCNRTPHKKYSSDPRVHDKLTWADLEAVSKTLTDEARIMALRYGYVIHDLFDRN